MLDTTRRVATPEGIELTLHLAGPVPRAIAWAIDLAIRCMLELQRRAVVPAGAAEKYMEDVNRKTRAPGSG